MRLARHSLGAALVALSVAAPAPGQGDVEQARILFNAGAKAYADRDYPVAIQAFREAHRLSKRPGLLFSIAQAYRQQLSVETTPRGKLANGRAAAEYYRDYLAQAKEGARVADAARALSELEPALTALEAEAGDVPVAAPSAAKVATRITVSSPTPGATLAIDGKRAGPVPFTGEVKPGKRRLTVSARGYRTRERTIVVPEGGFVPLDVGLAELPAELSVSAPEGATVSVDGRPLGVAPLRSVRLDPGLHFVAVTENGSDAFAQEIEFGRGEQREVVADLRTTRQRNVAWVLMGTGLAAVLAGGFLGFVALDKENRAQDIFDARREESLTPDDREEYLGLRDERDTFRAAALVTGGAGLVVGATGILLYLFDEPRVARPALRRTKPEGGPREKVPGSPSMEVSAVPLWRPGLAGASLAGTF